MSVSPCQVVLSPEHRRRLAAVVLRGNLATYDATPSLAEVIDQVAATLVQLHQQHAEESWNHVADRVIDRFAYRAACAQRVR